MRNASPFLDGNFCGRDLNVLINLDGIAVDNLAVQLQSNFNPERALARRGWANNCD
jgi:hypothetical protein